MNGYSIWRMIRHYDFNLQKVADHLFRLGATPFDIGMSSGLNDVQRGDLIDMLNARRIDKIGIGKGKIRPR